MPVTTSCPGCSRPLRVPDTLVGKAVRCPACETEWTIPAGEEQTPSSAPALENPGSDIPQSPALDDHVAETPRTGSLPVPPPPPLTPDDGDLGDNEDDAEDEEFERNLDERRSRRLGSRRLQDAKAKLLGPAIGMFVVSGMLFIDALFRVVSSGFMAYSVASMPAPGPGANAPMIATAGFMVVYTAYLLAMAIVTLLGGIQLLRVRRWGLCLAACICAMLPNCECCFLLGIPFGVWGMVMLTQRDVKIVFSRPQETLAA